MDDRTGNALDSGSDEREADLIRTLVTPDQGTPADPGGASSGTTTTPTHGLRFGTILYQYGVFFALIFLFILFSVLLPHTFFTLANIQTIISSQAVLFVLALGLTLPLVTGEFDLSIGATLGLTSVVLTYVTGASHWSLALAIIFVLLMGALIGLINGFFVVKIGVGAFITTLGTSTVLAGLELAVTGGQILSGVPLTLTNFLQTNVLGLPLSVYLGWLFALVLWYVYEHTPVGRYLYFVGAGREAARLVGLRVNALRWGAFIASGFFSAAAGIISVAQAGGAQSGVGETYLLPAYAAAFLGATTIKPGRFNAWGTVVALYLLVIGSTGLELLGASSWVEQVFNGVALVIAVTLARIGVYQSR